MSLAVSAMVCAGGGAWSVRRERGFGSRQAMASTCPGCVSETRALGRTQSREGDAALSHESFDKLEVREPGSVSTGMEESAMPNSMKGLYQGGVFHHGFELIKGRRRGCSETQVVCHWSGL